VCCRVADYRRLAEQLRLQGAVEIRLLTRKQVDDFLRSVSPRLSGVTTVLDVDSELWELLTTPLMLTIMVIAEEGRIVRALAEGVDAADRRRLLFDAYVVEMLARRHTGDGRRGDARRTVKALGTLASASVRLTSGVNVVKLDERVGRGLDDPVADVMRLWLSPATLSIATLVPVAALSRLDTVAALIVGVLGMFVTFAAVSPEEPSRVRVVRWWLLPVYGLAVAVLTAGVVLGIVQLVGLVQVSQKDVITAAPLVLALLLAVLMGWAGWPTPDKRLITWIVMCGFSLGAAVLFWGVTEDVLGGWGVGVGHGLVFAAATFVHPIGIGSSPAEPRSTRLRDILIVIYAAAVVATPFVVAEARPSSTWQVMIGGLVGFACGVLPGTAVALYYLNFRYMHAALVIAGEQNPWRKRFLRFAVDRSFLTYVDGEYRFVHLLVRDHLSTCDPVSLGEAVLRRRAELATSVPSRSPAV
jgi:hypothetical protein